MTVKLLGIKIGMTRLFDAGGNVVVCSVIKAEPNVISQVIEQGNYKGLQLAAVSMNEAKQRNVSKPLKGHFAKSGIQPKRYLHQCSVEDISSYQVGSSLGLETLEGVKFVDISGVSKGKGYQGVMKRHNFAGGPAAHGSSFHRHAGSTGQRTTPGRCLPGVKKAGHMGSDNVTVQNLRVVQIDKDNNLIMVEGAVPGPKNGVLYVSKSIKKSV